MNANNTPAVHVNDNRAKTPTLAQAAAAAQGVKPAPRKPDALDKELAKLRKAAPAPAADKEKAKAKAAADKAKAPKAEGDDHRLVPADLSHYLVSKDKKTAGGHASVDTDDNLARDLRGQTLDVVYKKAAQVLGETEKDLRARYGHLNNGMQRMNLGNRMRAEKTGPKAPTKKAAPKAKK